MSLKNLAFFVSCFGVHRIENILSMAGYSLMALNKLKPAVTNYSKFMRSRLVVSSKTIYGGYSLIILNKLNYQPL